MYKRVLTCALLVIVWSPLAWGQENGESNKVVIRGQEYEIYPPEKLRARGFEVPDIPHDENAAWVLVEAINARVDLPEDLREAFDAAMGGQWPDGEAGERLAGWLEQNKASLDLARQATTMDEFYMPFFRGDTDALIQALLPTLSDTRMLSKTLSVEAAYQMSKGSAEAAIECCLTSQRMGHQVGNGKTIIEGLVGIAVGALAQQGMMRIAESGKAGSEALKTAVAEMEALSESFPTFERMVRAERQWAESFIDDAFDMPGAFTLLTRGVDIVASQPDSPPSGWHRLGARLKRLYLPDRAIKRHFRQHYDALIEATHHEDGTVGMVIEEVEIFKRIPPWDTMSRVLLPSFSRAHELTLRAESNYVRTRLTMAVEAYKADHGRCPPTLSALVPAYVASVPADPMTGYDFEFQVTGGEKSGYTGLTTITRESEDELRKKRRTPAILNPRASKWRRHVQSVCDRYKLTDAQRASAEAILRDLEARAARYEQVHGAKLQQLVEAGDPQELARRIGPLDEMFKELRGRLKAIPTAEQQAAVEKNETEK
ncbi:MAG: hypothetical protein JXQ75_02215 [Phycisphaerae bacterium]|nr:hypothetical protein [Phycisphaerae bacterium]